MTYDNYCPSCFKDKGSESVCMYCGYCDNTQRRHSFLPCWAFINNRYLIGLDNGHDKNCIRYRAWDFVTRRIVCVEELFPAQLVQRAPDGINVQPTSQPAQQELAVCIRKATELCKVMKQFSESEQLLNVYDCFEENGTLYTVTELLTGETLNEYLDSRGGIVDACTAVAIMSPVLAGLSQIHAAGLIHRNVTPRNIFICSDGRIKLINFKIVKEATPYKDSPRTVALTPGYAPPEQYLSKSKQGPFSDIYSVGAILYKILTGVRPPDAVSRSGGEQLEDPRKLNPSIPEEVSLAVVKALSLESELRFKKASDFSHCLLGDKGVVDIDGELAKIKNKKLLTTAIAVVAAVAVIVVLIIILS